MDGRLPGTRPFCLLDYFPKDYLMVIDESHATFRKFMQCTVAIEAERSFGRIWIQTSCCNG
jgi:excinuclease UvrABC helicase subunit UvrB